MSIAMPSFSSEKPKPEIGQGWVLTNPEAHGYDALIVAVAKNPDVVLLASRTGSTVQMAAGSLPLIGYPSHNAEPTEHRCNTPGCENLAYARQEIEGTIVYVCHKHLVKGEYVYFPCETKKKYLSTPLEVCPICKAKVTEDTVSCDRCGTHWFALEFMPNASTAERLDKIVEAKKYLRVAGKTPTRVLMPPRYMQAHTTLVQKDLPATATDLDFMVVVADAMPQEELTSAHYVERSTGVAYARVDNVPDAVSLVRIGLRPQAGMKTVSTEDFSNLYENCEAYLPKLGSCWQMVEPTKRVLFVETISCFQNPGDAISVRYKDVNETRQQMPLVDFLAKFTITDKVCTAITVGSHWRNKYPGVKYVRVDSIDIMGLSYAINIIGENSPQRTVTQTYLRANFRCYDDEGAFPCKVEEDWQDHKDKLYKITRIDENMLTATVQAEGEEDVEVLTPGDFKTWHKLVRKSIFDRLLEE